MWYNLHKLSGKGGIVVNNFNGLEIIRTAILMEDEGSKFYKECAKHADGKVKDFLLIAAGQEFVHKEKFQKIYDNLSMGKADDYEYLFDEETSLYLKSLIENKVFNQKDKPQEGFKNIKETLEYAVKSEKLTVELYTKMYSDIKDEEVKNVLEGLIEEEKSHVDYFQMLFDELK